MPNVSRSLDCYLAGHLQALDALADALPDPYLDLRYKQYSKVKNGLGRYLQPLPMIHRHYGWY
jgi:hypothetical protein